jgi:hypothetical protein
MLFPSLFLILCHHFNLLFVLNLKTRNSMQHNLYAVKPAANRRQGILGHKKPLAALNQAVVRPFYAIVTPFYAIVTLFYAIVTLFYAIVTLFYAIVRLFYAIVRLFYAIVTQKRAVVGNNCQITA